MSVQFLYYENGTKSEYSINTLHANIPSNCKFIAMGGRNNLSVIVSTGTYNFDKRNLVQAFVSVHFLYERPIFFPHKPKSVTLYVMMLHSYRMSNWWIIVDDHLGRMRKEMVVVYFQIVPHHSLRGTQKKSPSKIWKDHGDGLDEGMVLNIICRTQFIGSSLSMTFCACVDFRLR